MLIRKTQQPSTYPENQIHDAYSTSTTDTYSCNYINEVTKGDNGEPQYMVASLSAPIDISTSNEPVMLDTVSRQSGEGYFSLDTTTGSIKVLKDCHVLVSASAFIVGITGNCSAYVAVYKNLTDVVVEYDGVLKKASDDQFFHLTGPAQPLKLKTNDVLTLDIGYSGVRTGFTSIHKENTYLSVVKL